MSDQTFERILDSVGSIYPRPTVFLGGLGEPLFHSQTVEMVAQVKALGAEVELITNGTFETGDTSGWTFEATANGTFVATEDQATGR